MKLNVRAAVVISLSSNDSWQVVCCVVCGDNFTIEKYISWLREVPYEADIVAYRSTVFDYRKHRSRQMYVKTELIGRVSK